MVHSSEFRKEILKTIVLRLLSDKKMYGYEITQQVKGMIRNKLSMTEGGLYPTLYLLEKGGLLVTEKEYFGRRVRKYYSLSKQGRRETNERINELKDFMHMIIFYSDVKHAVA